MDDESRIFTARLLVAAGGVLLVFGWPFLRAGTGGALLLLGAGLVVTSLAFDRSLKALLCATVAVLAGAGTLALLTLPAFF